MSVTQTVIALIKRIQRLTRKTRSCYGTDNSPEPERGRERESKPSGMMRGARPRFTMRGLILFFHNFAR